MEQSLQTNSLMKRLPFKGKRAYQFVGVFFGLLFLTLFISAPNVSAQQSLEYETNSAPTPNTGPETSVTIRFRHNENNPSDDVFTEYLPEFSATILLDNFAHFVSQDTNNNNGGVQDGDTDSNPPVVIGWNFADGSPPDPDSDGSARNILVPFTDLSESIDLANSEVSTIVEYEGFFSSLQSTVNNGIDFETNYGVFIEAGFEGLGIDNLAYGGGRHRLADMTITFNQPVDDPVLHFFGLGGLWFYDNNAGDRWLNTASAEFDLIANTSDAGVTLSVLSTSDGLGVTGGGTQIVNNYNIPDVIDEPGHETEDSGVGNGSILVAGENITSLEFEVYARGISDPAAAQTQLNTATFTIADEDFGWNGDDFTNFEVGDGPDYNFASDLFHFSISTEVEPDNTQLTGDECFRMLSSPVDGTSYSTLLDPIWTQGMTGADYISGDPNVWLWPTNINDTDSDASDWNPPSDLGTTIPPGSGFLVSVFDDDVFNTPDPPSWPKSLSLTGSENAPLTFTSMNSTSDGWTLLGNPFKSTIDFDLLFNEASTNNITDAVYVYDRSTGSYASWTEGTQTGDLTGGLIAPFQGFFVQNSAVSSQVDFTEGVKSSTAGTFLGKDKEAHDFARFEVNGEDLYNSMWIHFSSQGTIERTRGDALELMPLTSEYAMLGTRKADGTIFDIGHYPIPEEEFEIPVSLETTRSGIFTITATDLDLSMGSDLYFIDLQEQESIRIDENFSYEFSTAGIAAKTPGGAPADRCSVDGPEKAKTIVASDRFMIATQPRDFVEIPTALALNQNYPNPFNPTTQIKYELPQQSDVRLEVYDLVGRQVATLVNQTVEAGAHTVNFDASNLSSGVYIYRLNAGSQIISRKLTIIK